jgi:hypothetical protein
MAHIALAVTLARNDRAAKVALPDFTARNLR